MAQSDQPLRGHAVAGRCGIVGPRLLPLQQRLVIVAREKESAVLAILEMLEQSIGELARERVILRAKSRLHELQQRDEQECVVVEIRIEVRALALARGEQAAVLPLQPAYRVRGITREVGPARLVERARSPCKA